MESAYREQRQRGRRHYTRIISVQSVPPSADFGFPTVAFLIIGFFEKEEDEDTTSKSAITVQPGNGYKLLS